MRAGYSVKRIKDICDKGSSNVAQKDLEGRNGEYPIFGASGLIKNVDFYHQEKESIGLVKDGSIGKVFVLPPKSSVIGTMQYIIPREGYSLRFVAYCLQSLDFSKYKVGAVIPHIYFRDYGEREVLVADDIKEQHRIVDILDQEFAKIDALKANAEKSLKAAKDLFQATLKKELEPKEGWSINRLGDICTITSSKRIYKNEYVPDGIPFYRTKEVKEISNGRPISVELYISRERYNEIKQKFGVPQPNDILVSAVGTIGEMMIVRDNSPFYFKDGNLVWLKGITNADPEYLRYYLQSVINQIKGMTIGAAYSALTIEKFQEMEVALAPSLLEQQAIVSRLDDLNDKCNTLQQNYQKTLTLCDDLKQSLLRKAFNGEL